MAPPAPRSLPARRTAPASARAVAQGIGETGARWMRRLFAIVGDAVAGGIVAGIVTAMAAAWLPESAGLLVQFGPFAIAMLIAALAISGLYSRPLMHPAVEMQRVSVVVAVVGLTAAGTTFLETGHALAASIVAGGGLTAALVVPLVRGLARVLVARTTWWRRPAVVLGTAPLATSVTDTLERWPELGLWPVGWLTAGAAPAAGVPAAGVPAVGRAHGSHHDIRQNILQDTPQDMSQEALREAMQEGLHEGVHGGPPVLGALSETPVLASRHGIRHAILALPDTAPEDRARLLNRYGRYFDQVIDVSDAHPDQVLWTLKYWSEGMVGTEVRHYALRPYERWVKRAIDILGSAIALLLTAPLMATVAALVRIDSRGPVFFRQDRMGRGGRCFSVLKFRTMYTDADDRLNQILQTDPERRAQYERYHKLLDDPRITRIGRILRRYSLDELPQLLNVLRGDMSLVGPRAYMPRELPQMKRLNPVVLQTPPGITGLWQVSGRNAVSFERRVGLDVHYIQNWSPWLDLYLLVRTLPVVLTGDGAR